MRTSRRIAPRISRCWALAGSLVLAYFVVFCVTAQQSWVAVAVELLVPVAFAVGALLWTDRELPFAPRRVTAAVGVVLLAGLPLVFFAGLTTSRSGQSWFTDNTNEAAAYDRVAPAWPEIVPMSSIGNGWTNQSVIQQTWQLGDPSALAPFRDIRFEAWHGVTFPAVPAWVDDFVPAPGYAAPFESEPAVVKGDTITVRFDMSHVRETRWIIFLTGIGPDGIRYRIDPPMTMPTVFSGTVWDWLTAGD